MTQTSNLLSPDENELMRRMGMRVGQNEPKKIGLWVQHCFNRDNGNNDEETLLEFVEKRHHCKLLRTPRSKYLMLDSEKKMRELCAKNLKNYGRESDEPQGLFIRENGLFILLGPPADPGEHTLYIHESFAPAEEPS